MRQPNIGITHAKNAEIDNFIGQWTWRIHDGAGRLRYHISFGKSERRSQ
jgi:hypothetical protein